MNVLGKLQSLPEKTRKIILLVIIIIIGLVLLTFWIRNFQERLKSLKTEEFQKELNIPSFEEELKKLPKFNGEE